MFFFLFICEFVEFKYVILSFKFFFVILKEYFVLVDVFLNNKIMFLFFNLLCNILVFFNDFSFLDKFNKYFIFFGVKFNNFKKFFFFKFIVIVIFFFI